MDFLKLYRTPIKQVKHFILPLYNIPYIEDKNKGLEAYFYEDSDSEYKDTIALVIKKDQEDYYKDFINNNVLKNSSLVNYTCNEGVDIYVFSDDSLKEDIEKIKGGKISQLSAQSKKKIKDWHFKRLNKDSVILNYFFNPKTEDFKLCAKQLGESEEDVSKSGELCPKINLANETFRIPNFL